MIQLVWMDYGGFLFFLLRKGVAAVAAGAETIIGRVKRMSKQKKGNRATRRELKRSKERGRKEM
jgi:hypothetical protein